MSELSEPILGQTTIEVPQHAPQRGPCAWCGKPSRDELVIEPEKYGMRGNVRVITKRAITAPACSEHMKIIGRQRRRYACGCELHGDESKCPKHGRKVASKW